MLLPLIALCFGLIGIAIAIRANAALRHEDRVPMQWSVTGQVNWTAPRLVGLAFSPALTIGVLGLVCLASPHHTRPGQEHLVVPMTLISGTVLTAIQLLHLWLVFRTLKPAEK